MSSARPPPCVPKLPPTPARLRAPIICFPRWCCYCCYFVVPELWQWLALGLDPWQWWVYLGRSSPACNVSDFSPGPGDQRQLCDYVRPPSHRAGCAARQGFLWLCLRDLHGNAFTRMGVICGDMVVRVSVKSCARPTRVGKPPQSVDRFRRQDAGQDRLPDHTNSMVQQYIHEYMRSCGIQCPAPYRLRPANALRGLVNPLKAHQIVVNPL